MNFEKIEIYGFKSFADKVEISFEPGITAIVGPNGCGKSNVADSIRFVMGESSAKQMRGSSMQDVIFNGTEKRKALSYCEVSLHFDNSAKIFKLDYDKVVLTRKLYKSGESEYLINKTPCRRKDIVDAFRDIGLGKESYSVIGQGKIDSILSAKPEDRRNVFEEAAGISKFKEERNTTQNKLTNVQDNLTRINDIMSELERQLGPLKTQAENAKVFLELSNRLKELEISIYVYSYDGSSEEKRKITERINAIDEELSIRQTEFEQATKEYEISQSEMNSLDETINELRNELLNLSVSLEKQNGEIKLYDQKISILKEQNEKLLGEVERGKFVQENAKKQNETLELSKTKLEEELNQANLILQELETNYRTTLDKLSLGLASAETMENEFVDVIEKQGDIKSLLLKYQTELGLLQENEQSAQKDKNQLENEAIEFEQKFKTQESVIEKLDEKIENRQAEKYQIVDSINVGLNKIQELEEKIQQRRAVFHSASSKHDLLTEMRDYNEGFMIGVKRLLEQAKNGSQIGNKVLGVVANLISVPEKYEVAVEMALGSAVQNIVTRNEDDAKELINYLKTNKFGWVTFLPLTSMKERTLPYEARNKLSMSGICGVADELISFDPKYKRIFSSLLGNTVFAENLDRAVDFARATGFSVRVVTLDGNIVSTAGSLTGGSRKENVGGLVGRDREIEKLEKQLSSIESEISSMNNELSKEKQENSEKNEKLTYKIDEIHSLEMERTKAEELLTSYENKIDEINSSVEEFERNINSVAEKIQFVNHQIELIGQEQENANQKKTETTESRKQANSDFEKLRATRDEIQEQISKIKIEIETKKNSLQVTENELERLLVETAKNEYASKENMLEIQKNNAKIEEINAEIQKIMGRSDMQAGKAKIDDVTAKISELSQEKKISQQKMNDADGRKMLLSGEIQRAKDRRAKEENAIVKIDSDLENMQNKVWEDYEMTYADAKTYAISNFDLKQGMAESAEIKRKIQRLGNVNVSAIEDIKVVYERYNDLSAQRDDLVKAREDLDQIIKNLTETMENKFKECFNQIRENFKGIFRELFEGGRADIYLEDENNCLECGVDIIAEPPGKTLRSITLLSGGEKALTAVAILFSILKLKPMPFCVLDEIEAAFDDTNVERYARYLHRYTGDTQFIVITHRKPTMELADALYGVTMEEKGVSKVVSVKLSEAIKLDGSGE